MTPFHVIAKPAGSSCNLACEYCFYRDKSGDRARMSQQVTEAFVRQYIRDNPAPEVSFSWQGGEPTLAGLAFFERVVDLQRRWTPPGKRVSNALQTNGVSLDDDWCAFFEKHDFLVGISLDGPRKVHDQHRLAKGGQPTFDRVMTAIERMKSHRVQFNTLTAVNALVAQRPRRVYRFLRKHGSGFMQFIPIVERLGEAGGVLEPPVPGQPPTVDPAGRVAPWSVDGPAWGRFLCGVFDEWVRRDVGQCFVQLFDAQLAAFVGLSAPLCSCAETCGRALALEHDGSLFACDHFVYPRYRLGNILETPLAELVESPAQAAFGVAKRDALAPMCQRCDALFACRGGCPKHRFVRTPANGLGSSWLCEGHRAFVRHAAPHMRQMAELVGAGRPAAEVMRWRPGSAALRG